MLHEHNEKTADALAEKLGAPVNTPTYLVQYNTTYLAATRDHRRFDPLPTKYELRTMPRLKIDITGTGPRVAVCGPVNKLCTANFRLTSYA